jgi:hypothetical protein
MMVAVPLVCTMDRGSATPQGMGYVIFSSCSSSSFKTSFYGKLKARSLHVMSLNQSGCILSS